MTAQENNSPIGERKICPNPDCQFDKSRPRANFCILCGTLLYARCEDCLAENPMYAKFCNYCGANLDELREERQQTEPPPAQPTEADGESEPETSTGETKEEEENKGNIFDIG